MQLNTQFITNITETYHEPGLNWLAELPSRVEKICSQFNIEFIKTIPDLSFSFVAYVKMTSGQIAILKMTPDTQRTLAEYRWLKAVEQGVPEIYFLDEKLNALLMENLVPGYSLKKLIQEGQDDLATHIICNLIKKIQSRQHTERSFPHLSELSYSFDKLQNRLNNSLLAKARSLFHELTQDRVNDVVLHGDLHHDNILSARDEWKTIDPHGYLGDPAAEVGAMIRNPLDCFPKNLPLQKVLERRLKILCEELPFDPARIQAWLFCLTMLSIAWTVEGSGEVPSFELEVAKLVNGLIV